MSIFHDNAIVGSSGQATGYNLTRSLRFRASASAYLSRSLASSGNTNQWTFSTWLKRGALTATSGNPYQYCIFAAGTFGSVAATNALFYNAADSVLQFYIFDGSNFLINCDTSPAVFLDPSAWYHIVVRGFSSASGNSYGGLELALYVNGVQQAVTSNTGSMPFQNEDTFVNQEESGYKRIKKQLEQLELLLGSIPQYQSVDFDDLKLEIKNTLLKVEETHKKLKKSALWITYKTYTSVKGSE